MARDTSNTDCMDGVMCCDEKWPYKFSLPTRNGEIVHLAKCGKCGGGTLFQIVRLRMRATLVRTVSPDVVRRPRS